MNLLETLDYKVKTMGKGEVSKLLEVPMGVLSQFVSGKKSPSAKTCQKIIDLWGNGNTITGEATKEVKTPENIDLADTSGDGYDMVMTFDADACLNMSYCPPEWGLKKAAWPGRDVCIALPCYK